LTVAALPQAHLISMLGEVLLVAWTQDPLAAARVDGSGEAQNNLSLLVSPLTVGLIPGPLALRRGTLAASLVDEVPAPFTYPCCTPSARSIFIGAGGSATFEFDVPAPGRVRFRHLALSVWAGGPDPSYTGYTDMPRGAGQAYDWRARRWVDLSFVHGTAQLSNPDRFIEPTGAFLVRLRALDDTHELTLADPHQDLQISGSGTVR
jgi:hypothetical protein